MVVRRLSLPVIFYLDSFISRLLGESLYLSEEATVICNPTLPVNFILNFLNSALASSCFACLWLFHLFSLHLIRFIWVEYSHYCCLNQLSSLLFCFSAVEAFNSCQFYDLEEKFYFFLLSVHSESLWRVEQKTREAGCLSQLELGARHGVRGEIFYLPDFTGPISVICQMGRKPLSDWTDTHSFFFYKTKIITREEWPASKRHPQTRSCRAGIVLPAVAFLPSVSQCPQPWSKGPLCTKVEIASQLRL